MNITELALRLKLEVLRAVSNFNPQMNIKTRDLKDLVEALENSESRLHEVAVACATAEQALEKAQQRIAELEEAEQKLCAANVTLDARAELAERQLADLESLSVTVKLTDINEYLAEVHDKTLNQAFRLLAEGVRAGDVAAMRAAGIKVEVE
ncbi:hypothetical protein [Klebsiella pneumoniae]|uniref:hypothetical protein n=1 Tax=Klebsiella pneumoniae TaxID=573 RepID=UPI000E2AF7BE|nr:hypothetical protein [Klebsiella pneumoniae]SWD41984.1 Uncharacterised protein [Klebsiella pneumoniae]HBR3295092.1 hypothetical protein [Klebsiella pneumoniae]HBR3315426.1 hypothetical protein [Klebsiella pneumoniae]